MHIFPNPPNCEIHLIQEGSNIKIFHISKISKTVPDYPKQCTSEEQEAIDLNCAKLMLYYLVFVFRFVFIFF